MNHSRKTDIELIYDFRKYRKLGQYVEACEVAAVLVDRKYIELSVKSYERYKDKQDKTKEKVDKSVADFKN